MSYAGSTPHIDSIISSGDILANLTARTREAGTLVYATDTKLFYYDDGSALTAVGVPGGGVDAIDTLANLTVLPRSEGKLYYATDTDSLYTDDGAALNVVAGGGVPLMAKGSLITSNGVSNGELGVGADGEILVANSAAVNGAGIEWQAPAGGGGGAEVGSVITFTADTPPTGYLLCDGSLLNRTTYAALYAVIGDAYGNGDGSTTFSIPDFRGKFLRGTDKAAGNDPNAGARTASGTGGNTGDAIGSGQGSAMQNHNHVGGVPMATGGVTNSIFGDTFANWGGLKFNVPSDGSFSAFYARYLTSTAGGSTESRPINVNVNYMIKY